MTNKTAEEINTDKLLLWINRYLTRRFIADPIFLPNDECNKEAKVILDKCREQIRQQLIQEIEKLINNIPKDTRNIIPLGMFLATDEWQQFKRGE